MMMMMIEVHLYNNLLLVSIYLCRGGYGDWLHPENYLPRWRELWCSLLEFPAVGVADYLIRRRQSTWSWADPL